MIELSIDEKCFGDHLVLQHIDLRLAQGELLAVLASSGSGKTTLLHILAGLDNDYRAMAGAYCVPRCGVVFQEPRLMPWLTVMENLTLVQADQRRCQAFLQRVGLQHTAEQYPRELSGGMQKRIALIRALLVEPELLLLDEPFSSVDEVTAQGLYDILQDYRRENSCAVVLVTHDLDEALSLAQRVMILSSEPASVVGDYSLVGDGQDNRADIKKRIQQQHPHLFLAS